MREVLFLLAAVISPACAHADTALPVELIRAEPTLQSIHYALTGTIEATDNVPAAFRDGGRLVSVSVEAGDRLIARQEIARIDPTQAEAARRAAAAGLNGADASLLQAQLAYDRAVGALAKGTSTQAELDTATQALIAARSAREQAVAQLSKAETAVRDTVLRSTTPAIVTERLAEPGQVVGAGQAVARLASADDREAVFYAPDAADLESLIGHEFTLTLLDDPSSKLEAKLTEVSPLVDSATSTTRVKAKILTAGVSSLLGVPVIAAVELPSLPAIKVPWTALTATAAGPAVWTVDPQTMKADLTQIGVRTYTADGVVVATGLMPGQLVVGSGSQLLYPGRVVAAAKDEASADAPKGTTEAGQ